MINAEITLNDAVRQQRKEYLKGELDESVVSADPFHQFAVWLDYEFSENNESANVMTLSTVDPEGMPSSRVVLLRDVRHQGFSFFTNYQSKKAKDIKNNPKVALLFFWPGSERQVRIQGTIELLPEKESDDYFASRPFESRVGAWASAQSCIISSRENLENRYRHALELFRNGTVPRPVTWGGYLVKPTVFEFWQGRQGRLHDRIQYSHDPELEKWTIERLMP